jgi:hypothetical protein
MQPKRIGLAVIQNANFSLMNAAFPKDPQPSWMGYSVGRWDGDTQVVESEAFNDKTWLWPAGKIRTVR